MNIYSSCLIPFIYNLFEPERLIPSHLRPPNVTLRLRKSQRISRKAVVIYQSSNERVATESVEDIVVNKLMRLNHNLDPSQRLSMSFDDGKGHSRVSMRLNDGLPTDKKSFHTLKERLELQKEN